MKAVLLAVGEAAVYSDFFQASMTYLRQALERLKIQADQAAACSADEEELFELVREYSHQSQLVVLLTAPQPEAAAAVCQVVAHGLHLETKINKTALSLVQEHLQRTGMELSGEEQECYARMPQSALLLPNSSGFVQGYVLAARQQMLLVLPASPSELHLVFNHDVEQLLVRFGNLLRDRQRPAQNSGGPSAVRMTLKAAEVGNKSVAQLLEPFLKEEDPQLNYRYTAGDYEITAEATGSTRQEAEEKLDSLYEKLAQALGPCLYSSKRQSMAAAVCEALSSAGLTIAVAESGTGGLLSQKILRLSDTQRVLDGNSGVFYNRAKLETLDISKKLLSSCGTISRQAAAAMALKARQAAGTSLGVSITASVGKSSDPTKPSGVVYLAITNGKQVWSRQLRLGEGDADTQREIAALHALNMLRLYAVQQGNLPGGVPAEEALRAKAGGGKGVSLFQGLFHSAKSGSRSKKKGTSKEKDASNMEQPTEKSSLMQRFRAGKLTSNDKVRVIAVAVCLAVFLSCLVYIGSVYLERYNNRKLSDALRGLISDDITASDAAMIDGYPAAYLPKFANLYAQNEDIAGWIKIPDTQVDYAVVQTVDNSYYERRDFTRASNNHGVPFVDFRVDQRAPSTNTVIYAHNMNDGQMFGELLNYKSIAYYREHPLVQYDSVYYPGTYKIFGIVVCKKDDPEFNYHNFIEKDSDEDLMNYVNQIKERSLINTTVDVLPSDHLLTLSTCDYSFRSASGERIARFVVFARKVRDGESTEVDTAGATINYNPVMPAEWYAAISKAQEQERQAEEQAAASAAASSGKWLTDEEKSGLSAEEQTALSAERAQNAQKYLTSDEQSELSLDSMLYLIEQRKEMFQLYLSSSEQDLSLSKKLDLAQQRQDLAEQWLTDSEIYSAGRWNRIEALIEERMEEYGEQMPSSSSGTSSSGSSLPSAGTEAEQYIKDNPKWLDSGDSGLSVRDLRNLVEERKALAREWGVDSDRYGTWEEMSAAIDDARREDLYQSNRMWLNESERGISYSKMSSLIAVRKKIVSDAGFSQEDVWDSHSWDETQQIIRELQQSSSGGSLPSSSSSSTPPSSSSTPPSSSSTPPSSSSTPPSSSSSLPDSSGSSSSQESLPDSSESSSGSSSSQQESSGTSSSESSQESLPEDPSNSSSQSPEASPSSSQQQEQPESGEQA